MCQAICHPLFGFQQHSIRFRRSGSPRCRMVPENHVRLHPVSQGLSCRSPGWWRGILWPDGRYHGCQSLSALLGGALYLRHFRFRYRLFSGCNLRCVFCQNHNIALGKAGRVITPEHLVKIFLQLQEQGANNINLVTPTHFLPQIVIALQQAKIRDCPSPLYTIPAVTNLRRLYAIWMVWWISICRI